MARARRASVTGARADAPALPAPPRDADETALRAYGERLGAALRAPAVVTLTGDLGSGKTTLAQAIARGAGVRGDVTSPTFALVHEYHAPSHRVYHIDLYRLRNASELANLGWDEIVSSDGIVLIEWPERAHGALPVPRLDVTLGEVAGSPDRRTIDARWVR